jgi:hypothetical protein
MAIESVPNKGMQRTALCARKIVAFLKVGGSPGIAVVMSIFSRVLPANS